MATMTTFYNFKIDHKKPSLPNQYKKIKHRVFVQIVHIEGWIEAKLQRCKGTLV
jgi:hypothetical protein